MKKDYNQSPEQIVDSSSRKIACFKTEFEGANIDQSVVDSFGKEWEKFHSFDEEELEQLGDMYFDIVSDEMVNKNTYGVDLGCGTGRWTRVLADRIGFMESIDPSNAIFTADKVLNGKENVRLTKASIDNIPFEDETFDFAMSIGVYTTFRIRRMH